MDHSPHGPGGSPGGHAALSYAQKNGHANSLSIRQEIQRFESVHPSIYAIYDLIELIPDPLLAQQIREHVVCIEGKDRITSSSSSYRIAAWPDQIRLMA